MSTDVQGKDKGWWREANRRCQPHAATYSGVMLFPPPPLLKATFGADLVCAAGAARQNAL